MTLEHVIHSYGYLALVIGTFLEGETILVLGGIAAKLDYLKLPWVIASAFVGSVAGDQLFFFLGRRQGPGFLKKHPNWRPRVAKVRRMLERHRIPIIIGFRFLYGFRTVTPFALGMSRIPTFQFVALNLIGAAAWSSVFAVLGYAFGQGLELILGDIHHYEKEVLALAAAAGVTSWLIRLSRNRKHRNGGNRT